MYYNIMNLLAQGGGVKIIFSGITDFRLLAVDTYVEMQYNRCCPQMVWVLVCRWRSCGEFAASNVPRERGGKLIVEIRVGENESLESAIKRWKRKCARSGILADARKREHYEKPSVKRKKKAEAARKRKY